MSKTLDDALARVSFLVGTTDEDTEQGMFGQTNKITTINAAARFVVTAVPPEALGTMVVRAGHTIEGSLTPTYFVKDSTGNGRVVALAKGVAYDEAIPILSVPVWLRRGKSIEMSSSDRQSYYACEMGDRIYIRPAFAAQTTVIEVYVKDWVDLVNSTDAFGTPDHLFDWICLNAAYMLLAFGDRPQRMANVKDILLSMSAAWRGQWGTPPPSQYQPPQDESK